MIFTILFLLLLFFFLIRPAWRLYRSMRRQQQAAYSFFENMGFETPRSQGNTRRRRRQPAAQPGPASKKKKIDSSVGEYVKYEELSATESVYHETRDGGESSSSARVVVEQQIVDVEWEDIK